MNTREHKRQQKRSIMGMWWAFISQRTTKSCAGKNECMHAIDDLCFGASRSDAFCAFSFCYVARFLRFLSHNPNVYRRWPLFSISMRHFDIFFARNRFEPIIIPQETLCEDDDSFDSIFHCKPVSTLVMGQQLVAKWKLHYN